MSKPISSFSCSVYSSLMDWHSRLGHPNSQILCTMISHFLPLGYRLSSNSLICNSCSSNKSHKLPFLISTLQSSGPLDIISSEVWTSLVVSVYGYKYYIEFVYNFSIYTWVYPWKTKYQVAQIYFVFKNLVENRFKRKIITLYSDSSGEFIALETFLMTHGICHLTSSPHIHEHNGIAKQKHNHIIEMGLALCTHVGIPNLYWT